MNHLQTCRRPLPFHRLPLPPRRPLQSTPPLLLLVNRPRLVLKDLRLVKHLPLGRRSPDSASSPLPCLVRHLPLGSPRQHRLLDRRLPRHSLGNPPNLLSDPLHLWVGLGVSALPGRPNSDSQHSPLAAHHKRQQRYLHRHPSPKKVWLRTTHHPLVALALVWPILKMLIQNRPSLATPMSLRPRVRGRAMVV